MKDLDPLIVFFFIFFIGIILRVLAPKNLLEEYSEELSNVIFHREGSWSINRKMFNRKRKWYYIAINSLGILWNSYIIILVAFNSF